MKPKSEIEAKDYFKDIHFFYEIINRLKKIEEIKLFLKDILTTSELRMLKRRWHIACLLDEGWDLRKVAAKANASTQTVTRVKKQIEEGRGGLKLALERTRSERKEKIPYDNMGALPETHKGQTFWIFGKYE